MEYANNVVLLIQILDQTVTMAVFAKQNMSKIMLVYVNFAQRSILTLNIMANNPAFVKMVLL